MAQCRACAGVGEQPHYYHNMTNDSLLDGMSASPGSPAEARGTGVGVLDRVVAILDAVETTPMRSSELARHVGLSVPTAHRLVRAMVVHGLLRRDDEGRHWLGQRFPSSPLVRTAEPVLVALARQTGESCQLWVRRGVRRLCVVSIEADKELRASLPVSALLPISVGGSAAFALEAPAPEPEHPGWFESVAGRIAGVCSVSAPVRQNGEVLAAVCVSAPIARAVEGPGVRFGDAVVAAAAHLEDALRHGR
ncbi:IclR family transcriptional regulator [Pseudonocardia yunnanensis]